MLCCLIILHRLRTVIFESNLTYCFGFVAFFVATIINAKKVAYRFLLISCIVLKESTAIIIIENVLDDSLYTWTFDNPIFLLLVAKGKQNYFFFCQ